MGNFQGGGNRGGGFRGGNGGGGRPSFGGNRGGDRGPVTMHKAVCDECNKSCEVPFRPSGDKPIFCSDCFGSKKGNDDRGPRREFGGDHGPKRDFNASPAQSPFNKPMGAQGPDEVKKQLTDINTKLDRLASAIEKLTQPKVVSAPTMKVSSVAKVASKKAVSKTPTKKVVAKKKK